MKKSLGIWGLVTNIIFNISWQFVDNSSWQSIIAGAESDKKETAWNLKMSGLFIFLTVGTLGTLIGVALVNSSGIDPNSVLPRAVQLLPEYSMPLTFAMFVVIIACIMSLLDGLFLASALTLVMDILQSKKGLTWDIEDSKSKTRLLWVRVALVAIACIAIWGVRLIFIITGADLFDFVYIVIITQLALFGPVFIGLATNRVSKTGMWISILIALLIGFGSIAIGTIEKRQFLVDGAGTFALVCSLVTSFFVSKKIT